MSAIRYIESDLAYHNSELWHHILRVNYRSNHQFMMALYSYSIIAMYLFNSVVCYSFQFMFSESTRAEYNRQ